MQFAITFKPIISIDKAPREHHDTYDVLYKLIIVWLVSEPNKRLRDDSW